MPVEIITFRANPLEDNRSEKYPLEGVFKGTSVSHVALRITFKPTDLDQSYIKQLNKLNSPNKIIFHQNLQGNYELYYSFWPKEGWSTTSDSSRLNSYIDDCQVSELGSPIQYSEKGLKLLGNQDTTEVRSRISLMETKIALPPSVVFHQTRFEAQYKNNPNASKILESAQKFTQAYEKWRDGCASNIEANVANTKKNLDKKEQELKSLMFPNQNLNQAEFMLKLEPFFTFGNTERASVALPFNTDVEAKHNSNIVSLELSAVIDHILEVANNPKKHKYNLFFNNCANAVYNVLKAGLPQNAPRNILPLPIYYPITLFPMDVLKAATNMQIYRHAKTMTHAHQRHAKKASSKIHPKPDLEPTKTQEQPATPSNTNTNTNTSFRF